MINNRFKTKATPQEDAFVRLSEEGMLSALLQAEGLTQIQSIIGLRISLKISLILFMKIT